MPFVALVEHDHVDAGQLLVPLQPLQQHTGRDDLHARAWPHHPLPAHGVPDALADLLAQQPRHPPRGGTGGDPPRLGDDDPAHGTVAHEPGQHQRDKGRLAGAGRRHEHGGATLLQGSTQTGERTTYGQKVKGVVADHMLSLSPSLRPGVPPSRFARTRRSPSPG